MAFHYLIDGYNLIYAWPNIPPGSWQKKRQVLLDFLKQRRPQGKNPVTVVFDSREGSGNESRNADMTVVYTAGETADDWISHKVRGVPNPGSLIVVSNDKGLRAQVRGTGAKFILATDFLNTGMASPARKSDRQANLPEAAQEITEEFEKKWLPKDGNS